MRGNQRLSRPRRDAGSALVLVLGVSSIVGLIGLSSMLAVRLQHADVRSRGDALRAQQLADSALRVVHMRLGDDPDWRSSHTHGAWTEDEPFAAGTLRYRLADTGDTDLDDDPDDHARLTVRVALGDAVRLVSVELGGGNALGPELTTNRDMEAGADPYAANIGAGVVTSHTDSPLGGTRYNRISGRATSLSSWKQDLDGLITESGKTYRISMWMRPTDADVDMDFGLFTRAGIESDILFATAPGSSTAWTYFETDQTTGFAGSLDEVYVFGSTSSTNQDIDFDDISVREVIGRDAPPVVRGSYRRELDE